MVNITDVGRESLHYKEEVLETIFNGQKELMKKYGPIEEENGFRHLKAPVNIHDRFGQAKIKDFAWRATEEMMEYREAVKKGDLRHALEELSDVLHFITEFTILTGVTPTEGSPGDGSPLEGTLRYGYLTSAESQYASFIDSGNPVLPSKSNGDLIYMARTRDLSDKYSLSVIYQLGLCCNMLKNKPWKKSQMITDEKRFFTQVGELWKSLLDMLFAHRLDPEGPRSLYLDKHAVNQFRQRSGY